MVVNLLNSVETNIAAPHKEIYQPGLFFDRGEMGYIESFISNFWTNTQTFTICYNMFVYLLCSHKMVLK